MYKLFFSDITVTLKGDVTEEGQIILNCSIIGSHNKNIINDFQFNDKPSYLCDGKTTAPTCNHSTSTPYVCLLDDDTTCQLIIPSPTNADYTNYRCRVRIRPQAQTCYSDTITISPYEGVQPPLTTTNSKPAKENGPSSYVTKTEVYSIGGIILVSLVVAVVIVVTVTVVNYRFRRRPPIQAQRRDGTCTYSYTHTCIQQLHSRVEYLCPPSHPPTPMKHVHTKYIANYLQSMNNDCTHIYNNNNV